MGGIKWSSAVLFLFAATLLTAAFSCSSSTGGQGTGGAEWVMMDESYVPKDDVEAFIKADAVNRGALPLFIRNHKSDKRALSGFKGRQYAGPSPRTLEMLNPGLDDWMLVDIRYKSESEREIVRTVLYLSIRGVWKVGDSGTLIASS